MPASVAAASDARDGAPPIERIAALLARPPRVDKINLDTSFFAASEGAGRALLPAGYEWRADAQSGSRVPLQLCEFLAYKTALAYETAPRIEAYLAKCCNGISRFRFFDSARDPNNKEGVLADAQGYGFVFESKAYVIFRGTESGNDWKINRIDVLTSELGIRQDEQRDHDSSSAVENAEIPKDRRAKKLAATYGPLLRKLGNLEPGRHVGFSIAWAALKNQVEDWLAEALEQRAIEQIVYSGHSLGGAMAQIAAFDHARLETKYEKDRGIAPSLVGAVVTFGAPAVGNEEFAEEYGKLLGDRTVLLESSGDLVPRIMQRWYYRMLYPLRQRIKAGVQAHLKEDGAFSKVVTPWSFASEPPLSNADIDAAISEIQSAARKALREAAEQEEKRKKAEEKKQAEASKAGAHPASQPQAGKGANTSGGSGKDAAPNGKSEGAPSVVYWVVAGVVVIVVAGVAWYFVRRKLFSHDIEQRYALYLSTLSYQQLRANHAGNIELANSDLRKHLEAIRGDAKLGAEIAKTFPNKQGKYPLFFESVHTLPLPIEIRKDPEFVKYLEHHGTFI